MTGLVVRHNLKVVAGAPALCIAKPIRLLYLGRQPFSAVGAARHQF